MKRFLGDFSSQRECVIPHAICFLLLVLAFGVAPVAAGPTLDIRVDVTGYSGTPSNWNKLDVDVPVTNLIDYNTHLATEIDADMDMSSWDKLSGSGWNKGDVDWVDKDAAATGIGCGTYNEPWQVTFSDLNAGYLYTVEVVGSFWTSDIVVDYTVNDTFADDNYLGTAGVNGDDFHLYSDGYVPGNWLIWTDVQPDSNSEIIVETTFLSGYNGSYINAIRLTATPATIPVPSSILLTFIGLGTIRQFMKKKKV